MHIDTDQGEVISGGGSRQSKYHETPSIDASLILDRALDLAERLCDLLDPKLHRLCLVHDDPHDRNCLVDGSPFTGLLDCEVLPALRILLLELNDLHLAHSIVPACLAAEYPPYLRWDGMREDRCAALTEHGDIDYMNPALVSLDFLHFTLLLFYSSLFDSCSALRKNVLRSFALSFWR
jgi:hypothetical protein